MIISRVAFCYFILVVLLFLVGCSSAPEIIIKEIKVPYYLPAIHDTITLKDTVIKSDSAWIGSVTDSLGRVIGDLTVYFKKKIASINLLKDTIYVPYKDTIQVPTNSNSILPLVNSYLSWWEKGILYGGLGTIISFLIYLRIQRGKVI